MISRQEAFQIFLRKEMEEPYFKKIQETVRFYDTIDIVTPDYHNCLNCLNFNDIRAIKVIIIGYKPLRDYYAADYLAFSSYDYATYEMQRLYKKIYDDTGQIYNQMIIQKCVGFYKVYYQLILNLHRARAITVEINCGIHLLKDN